MSGHRRLVRVAFLFGTLGLAALSQAALVFPDLVQIGQSPISDAKPAFVFSGGSLQAGPGSVGNGDGLMSPDAQTAGGLQVQTPFVFTGAEVPAAAGGVVDIANASTSFYDATLTLTGLASSAPASSFATLVVQPLGPGHFTLTATDGTLLLAGDINFTSSIVGSGTAADFKAASVTYTGGAILTKFASVGGSTSGDISIALSPSDDLAVGIGSGVLADFTAGGNGHFNGQLIPEPSSLGLGALVSIGLLAMRRRRA